MMYISRRSRSRTFFVCDKLENISKNFVRCTFGKNASKRKRESTRTHTHTYWYIYIHTHIYIYTHRERETDRQTEIA